MKKLALLLLIIIAAGIYYFWQKEEVIKNVEDVLPPKVIKNAPKPKQQPKIITEKPAWQIDCEKNSPKNELYFCFAKSGQWQTNDIRILKQTNNKGFSVAHYLAQYNPNWHSDNISVLKMANNSLSVAHVLAEYNPTWTTSDAEILSLKNNTDESVAHFLVIANKIEDIKGDEILNLTTSYGVSVGDLLKKRK
ncbi:MAG: hypothetical protein FWE18_01785 [Alphaproteobacteria bacterium]|nr:hypothetical protein [Alphaproteobacteria bacterium]